MDQKVQALIRIYFEFLNKGCLFYCGKNSLIVIFNSINIKIVFMNPSFLIFCKLPIKCQAPSFIN